ncbi:Piso0_001530 [Millerozyma farinosa CBS 7064]|uniref:Cell division control protein n=1 Tax=Pichia sorbitophila (strain ATCC MYA-4447 / BCRC 22081 / CBS 7064 / NBRC 10061 / NRRL Y-12695) TaxID=559304 RepID=G8YNE7_PICSO|nr:Piso0_001530 [Millerozyma farinosa CBS 7064]
MKRRFENSLSPVSKKLKNNDEIYGRKGSMLADHSNIMLDSPPATPEKRRFVDIRDDSEGKESAKKKLSFITPPTTPQKCREKSVYSKAKALFQRGSNLTESTESSHLVGRESEAKALNEFCLSNIRKGVSNSLYICGPPGTGKSAQVDVSFQYLSQSVGQSQNCRTSTVEGKKVKFIRVNCMPISKPESIFHEIYCALNPSDKLSVSYTKRKTDTDLFSLLCQGSDVDSAVILLDEMDCLITRDQQVLFKLFNLASERKNSSFKTNIILVCISNALDLMDKFLPILKRNALSPQALHFLPYAADQIKRIIVSKLQSLRGPEQDKENIPPTMGSPIMHPAAIQLCCRKSGSVTGDLRKAFDICYKSIEMVEMSLMNQKEATQYTVETAPKVQISHIAKVCQNSFANNVNSQLDNLNLLQKTVLCCLVVHERNNCASIFNRVELTVNFFYDVYVKISKDHFAGLLGAVKKSEFLEIISTLEASSAVVISATKHSRNDSMDLGGKLLKANISFDALLKCTNDIGILRNLLHSSAH